MCEDEFISYLKKSNKAIDDLILIIDEADQVLFTDQTSKMIEKELI
jgi:hypothetical protein